MPKRTRVLIVEDEIEAITKLYIGLLRMDFIVEVCDRTEEIMQRMNRFKPQIILISQKLFQADIISSIKEKFSTPVIEMMRSATELLSTEADDRIFKPLNLLEIEKKIDALIKHP